MTKEKWNHLAWVLILVPLVLTTYTAIKFAGFQVGGYWGLRIVQSICYLALLVAVPVTFKRFLSKCDETATDLKIGGVLILVWLIPFALSMSLIATT